MKTRYKVMERGEAVRMTTPLKMKSQRRTEMKDELLFLSHIPFGDTTDLLVIETDKYITLLTETWRTTFKKERL